MLYSSLNSLPPSRDRSMARSQHGQVPVEEKEKKKTKNQKQHRHHTEPQQTPPAAAAPSSTTTGDLLFKPSSDVKGIRFGGQFVVKSFTVRRAGPLELPGLLGVSVHDHPSQGRRLLPYFPSTIAYFPTNFTILAHHAWHTLTLGLGTKRSKVLIFVFESDALKAALDRIFPAIIPLGDVNRRLVRGLAGCEMARFKFRKGSLTFYIYAVRRVGNVGFSRADDLRRILEVVAAQKDFLDHTAMLALPKQRSIVFSTPPMPAPPPVVANAYPQL